MIIKQSKVYNNDQHKYSETRLYGYNHVWSYIVATQWKCSKWNIL